MLKENLKWLIALVASIAAIIIPILYNTFTREQRSFSYEIISFDKLITLPQDHLSGLTLQYKGMPVEEPYLTIVKMQNTGNVPIKKTEFDKPISIKYKENVKVLEASITGKEPETIETSLSIDTNQITLSPTLLNPGDSLIIRVLTTKTDKSLTVSGRIVGVNQLTKRLGANKSLEPRQAMFLVTCGLVIFVIVLNIRFASFSRKVLPEQLLLKQLWLLILTLAALGFLVGLNLPIGLLTLK